MKAQDPKRFRSSKYKTNFYIEDGFFVEEYKKWVYIIFILRIPIVIFAVIVNAVIEFFKELKCHKKGCLVISSRELSEEGLSDLMLEIEKQKGI